MKINAIQAQNYNSIPRYHRKVSKPFVYQNTLTTAHYTGLNAKANFLPVSFTGNAPSIKNAFIITKQDDIPLLETKQNGSYIIDFDSQTEVIYGKQAVKFLNKTDNFPYDTQIIIPKKCEGELEIDGENIPLGENSAVMLNGGTKAKISIKKGYPMVIFSKKDYDWYERYGKNAKAPTIQGKFSELMYYNSHLYNGDFSPNMLLGEGLLSDKFLKSLGIDKYKSANNLIYDLGAKRELMSKDKRAEFDKKKALLDKLFENDLIEMKPNGYVRFKIFYTDDYQTDLLAQKGFSKEEIDNIMPVFKLTKMLYTDSRFVRKDDAADIPPDLAEKMKQAGILYNNKKRTENLFWRETFGNEQTLRERLTSAGFNFDEQNLIVNHWINENNTGYDISGLRFINKNAAVYNLERKVNNWTLEKTNWVTNSTAMSSSDGVTPFIGTSLVQTDEEKIFSMSELRKGEHLHKHPNLDERRQTEMYMITSGAAALIIVKDGKPKVKILKEGDLAVIDPGVEHCVNSVLGEYEHIVVQVPSAFQYGFDFKCITKEPDGFNAEEITQNAKKALANSNEI